MSGVSAEAMFAAAATSAAAAANSGSPSLRRVVRSPAKRLWMPSFQLPVSRSDGTASRQSFAMSHAASDAATSSDTDGWSTWVAEPSRSSAAATAPTATS